MEDRVPEDLGHRAVAIDRLFGSERGLWAVEERATGARQVASHVPMMTPVATSSPNGWSVSAPSFRSGT